MFGVLSSRVCTNGLRQFAVWDVGLVLSVVSTSVPRATRRQPPSNLLKTLHCSKPKDSLLEGGAEFGGGGGGARAYQFEHS